MSKRRTRKQKETAHHSFALTWSPEPVVKGQTLNQIKKQKAKSKDDENANKSAKELDSEPTKRNIIKSLILASLILGLELVIYLGWSH